MNNLALEATLPARKAKNKTNTTITKQPIEPEAYYSIREISDRNSPHYTVSPATIFRALRTGTLKACYVGRKVLLKGAAIRAWIEGGAK